jgi:signal transduction histidine kinase
MVLDINGVVKRSARDAARSLGREAALEIKVSEEPVMVWASVAPLELSVGNIVRNAIEASRPGEPVRLSILCDGDWAEIRVDDCGPGLSETTEERVFEPFYSTKTDRGGSGLGLSITRDMIGQLGGNVRLENRANGGARATIRLQRWQDPNQSS